MKNLIPIRISKISSNDSILFLYIPKEARKSLDLSKGDKVLVCTNEEKTELIVRKIEDVEEFRSV